MNVVASSCLIAVLLVGCSHRDAVDRVVVKESRNEWFHSGIAAGIFLPASASPAQVVSRALQAKLFVPAATNFTLARIRQVSIAGCDYTAVLADTKLGQKVVLLRFEPRGTNDFWWTRVYDVE